MMIINRLTTICWKNLLIVVLLLYFITCAYCSDCPNSKEIENYNAMCTCESKDVRCNIGAVENDSLFWTKFSHLETPFNSTYNLTYNTIYFSIYQPDTSTVNYFPTALFETLSPSTEEVTLANWKFTSIPPFKVSKKSSVKLLTIKDSDNFTTIDRPQAFAPLSHSLERLFLTSNQLRTFDRSAFHGLKNVVEIRLFANNLTFLPANLFINSIKLTNLSLSRNSITTIQKNTFSGLNNLRDLELNRNKLFTIKDYTFVEISNLRSLDLSHNEINSLEPLAFYGLKSVESIDLSNNHLRSIPPEVLTYTHMLADIDLKHNQLTSLSDIFLKQLPKTAFLKDNQWTCNCNLLSSSDTFLSDNSEAKCTTSSDKFNENGKPVQILEMTFKQYIKHIAENPKQCINSTNNNYKEKRSHLTMVPTSTGGQIFPTFSLVQLMVLNVLCTSFYLNFNGANSLTYLINRLSW